MLAIRMQRTGRKGHSQFRLVVQDSRVAPSSGRVVAYLGSYNPHSKAAALDKDKAQDYLKNGARPSERVARLLKSEGVELPKWVNLSEPKSRTIRNQDKLRRNRPAEPVVEVETPAEAESAEPAEEPAEAPAAEEAPVEPAAEVSAEDQAA